MELIKTPTEHLRMSFMRPLWSEMLSCRMSKPEKNRIKKKNEIRTGKVSGKSAGKYRKHITVMLVVWLWRTCQSSSGSLGSQIHLKTFLIMKEMLPNTRKEQYRSKHDQNGPSGIFAKASFRDFNLLAYQMKQNVQIT